MSTTEQETVYFNSGNVSKADSQSPLTQLDPGDMEDELPKADPTIFDRYVQCLREMYFSFPMGAK